MMKSWETRKAEMQSSKPTVNFDTIPVFELRNPNGEGEPVKIYADGRVEHPPMGFTIVVNRIPLYIESLKDN